MPIFNDTKYGLTKVTSIAIDTTNSPTNYLWVAFAQNSNGVCLLKKVSVNNPSQVYYTISVPVLAINAMTVTNGYIFLAVNHSTIFSYVYSVSNPLTSYSSILKSTVGVTESPIGVTVGSNVYFLTSGIPSNVARIVSISTSNVYVETTNLQQGAITVNNASSLTVDGSNNIWVVTDTSPSNLIRVWEVSSVWHFEETILT